MLQLTCLGTGAAVPGPGRDNTSLVIDAGGDLTLIDASGAPYKRLVEAGFDPGRLARIIMTHEHLDHTYGYPSLLQSLWLVGRREPLPVYALPETWRFLHGLVDAFRPGSWTDGFPVEAREIVCGERPFLETESFQVRSARGTHSVPAAGVRFDTAAGGSIVYSSDTAPCAAITELARGADVLLHESTFRAGAEDLAGKLGHSTARQAADVAAAAGVGRLVLIHFTPATADDLAGLRSEGGAGFGAGVSVPSDGERLEVR
jgi:ribonuclease Z